MPTKTIFRVLASNDDGYTRSGSTGLNPTDPALYIGNLDSTKYGYQTYARLTLDSGTPPGKGQAIQSAQLFGTQRGSGSADFPISYFLEAADNPTTPSSADMNPATGRPQAGRVIFNANSAWTAGQVYSVDVTTLVQAVLNRSGYVAGNPFLFRLDPNSFTYAGENTLHQLHSYDSDPAKALWLEVTWELPAYSGSGSPTPPMQTATGTGDSANPPTSGTGTASAPSQTASGTGSSSNTPATGTGSAPAPQETSAGTGSSSNPETSGTGTASAPTQSATGTGATESEPPFVGTGEVPVPVETAAGEGSSDNPVTVGEGLAAAPEAVASGHGSTYLPPPKVDAPLTISPQSELANAIARHMLGLLPPGRKPKEGGRAFFTVLALAAMLAEADEAALELVFSWSPSRTPREDLLALIGQARGIKRGKGESFEAYRARVVNAAAFWRLGGTVPGVIAALETAGYKVSVTEHYFANKARWAEFSIDLFPGRAELTADLWDDPEDYWNDGTPWDWGISTAEGERIRDIIREMKAAHSKVRDVFYRHGGPPDYWNDDNGAWDDQSLWYGFDPIRVI